MPTESALRIMHCRLLNGPISFSPYTHVGHPDAELVTREIPAGRTGIPAIPCEKIFNRTNQNL